MTYDVRIVNLILVVIGLAVSIVGLLQVCINSTIDKRMRNFLTALFSVLTFYIVCLLVRGVTFSYQGDEWVILSRIVFFGQAISAASLTVLLTAFLLHQSGEIEWWKNLIFRISFLLWLVYAVLLIFNIFTGSIYSVDADNNYERGPLFSVLVAPTFIIACINLFAVYKRRMNLSAKQRHAFILYSVVPMIAMIIQTRVFGIHLIALSSVFSAIFMLIYIINDQTERYYIKEAENAKLKLDILQAQIQPHFLFNSLTTIKHLCLKDPESAADAIDQFMAYIRHNMDSLTAERPIEFMQELDHVKGYISLQKLRFGNDLSVVYDIEFADFKIPSLTLQPLVENAVTYGVRKNESGEGTVIIRSRKHENTVEVIVEDNGPGFIADTSNYDKNRAHIGIMNVRKRIEDIAGGELIIDSQIGQGTKAMIKLTLGE